MPLLIDNVLETVGPLVDNAFSPPSLINFRREFEVFDDFITGLTAGSTGFSTSVSGAGAIVSVTSDFITSTSRAQGVAQLRTGTTATGRGSLFYGTGSLLFGYGDFLLEMRTAFADLSTSLDRYVYSAGFFDVSAAGDAVDGAYFEYDESTSPNWRICTASNSSRTKVTTTVAVPSATMQKLKIHVNAAATLATFFIDDVNVGSITTTIPAPLPTARHTGVTCKIAKSVGLNLRSASIDYIYLRYRYNSPR